MTEEQFAAQLEFRICRELAGMADPGLRALWCDGVLLDEFLHTDPRPRVRGKAWMCQGQEQALWSLELLLPRAFSAREAIPWEDLLPPDDVTRWLTLDRASKHVLLEPASAVPDRA